MLLDVTGAVADIEKAFQVRVRLYQHPKENRTFFAPNVEPCVPAGLADSGYQRPGQLWPAASQFRPAADEAGAIQGADANLGSGPAGATGVTISETPMRRGLHLRAMAKRWRWWSLTAIWPVTFPIMMPGGFAAGPAGERVGGRIRWTPTGNGGEVEVSLDIEMANAMAPGLSSIISYEGDPDQFFTQ